MEMESKIAGAVYNDGIAVFIRNVVTRGVLGSPFDGVFIWRRDLQCAGGIVEGLYPLVDGFGGRAVCGAYLLYRSKILSVSCEDGIVGAGHYGN